MALPSAIEGVFTLEDAAREVLVSDFATACAEVSGLVADFEVTAATGKNIQLSDGRINGQGQEHIEIASAPVSHDAGVIGTRHETRLLVLRISHNRQRYTKNPTDGEPIPSTLENESWRICNGLARACELALLRQSGLLSKPSIYNADSRGVQRVPQDPAKPARYAVDLLIEVNMRVYDPVYMTT